MPYSNFLNALALLHCPLTKQSMRLLPVAEAEDEIGSRLVPLQRANYDPIGVTPEVLMREDAGGAYPVIDSVPITMGPELLVPENKDAKQLTIRSEIYQEAVEEKPFYGNVAKQILLNVPESPDVEALSFAANLRKSEIKSFPDPYWIWVDATYDSPAQSAGLAHLAPVIGKRILQIGGRGRAAIKFLLAGAAEAWLITPVLNEAKFANSTARYFGVDGRLMSLVGVAEELPFVSTIFDSIYLGGSLHHTITALSIPEAVRVLRLDGKFAAIEPWRTPVYGIGTRILGKREPDVRCKPLTADRVAPFFKHFKYGEIKHYGAFTRYLLITLDKIGLRFGIRAVWRIFKLDDALASILLPVRNIFGGSVLLIGKK